MAKIYFEQIDALSGRITGIDAQVRITSQSSPVSRRLQKMPGIGPITAMAVAAFAPPMDSFSRGRDFSAWLGLVPRQHSSGGKQNLGRRSKSGQRDIRRLLIIGAMAVISGAKARPPAEGSWLSRILARKPRMLAAIALANKMGRMDWAMISKGEEFRGGADDDVDLTGSSGHLGSAGGAEARMKSIGKIGDQENQCHTESLELVLMI